MISNTHVPYETRRRLHEAHVESFGSKVEDFLTFPDQRINPYGQETEYRNFNFVDDRHRKMNRIHPVYNGMTNVVPIIEKQIEIDNDNATVAAGQQEELTKERQIEKENRLHQFQEHVKKRVTTRQKEGKHEKEMRLFVKKFKEQQIRDKRLRMESYGERVSQMNKKKLMQRIQTQEQIRQQELQEQQNVRIKHGISPLHLPISSKQASPTASTRTSMPPSARTVESHASTPTARNERLSDRIFVPSRDLSSRPPSSFTVHQGGNITALGTDLLIQDHISDIVSSPEQERDIVSFDLEEQSQLLLQCSNAARASLMSHTGKGRKLEQADAINSRLFQRENDV
jgi:hypothetical protein